MSISSTRKFVQQTANVVSDIAIRIKNDHIYSDQHGTFKCFRFEIFHLTFLISKEGKFFVKSSLPNDNLLQFTIVDNIHTTVLHYVLYILTSNISVMENNIQNKDIYPDTFPCILDLIKHTKPRFDYKPIFMTPYFQIGTANVGLVFKLVQRGISTDYTVDRPIVTMGLFNVALLGLIHLGHIHNTVSFNDEDKQQQQKWFARAYKFSKEIQKQNCPIAAVGQDYTYEQAVTNLRVMSNDYVRQFIDKNTSPYIKDDCVRESLYEYAIDHKPKNQPVDWFGTPVIHTHYNRDVLDQIGEVEKLVKIMESMFGKDFDGFVDTNFVKVTNSSPTTKTLSALEQNKHKLDEQIASVEWELYAYTETDKGIKKGICIKELLECQNKRLLVNQLFKSKGHGDVELQTFFNTRLLISRNKDRVFFIGVMVDKLEMQVAFFHHWDAVLEFLTNPTNYLHINESMKKLQSALSDAVVEQPKENKSALTEKFLEKVIPEYSDNFTIKVSFDDFLKQTNSYFQTKHKLSSHRFMFDGKNFSQQRTGCESPKYLRITILTQTLTVDAIFSDCNIERVFIMKFSEYKRSEVIQYLVGFLGDMDALISRIVNSYNKQFISTIQSEEYKVAVVKDAIWNYVTVRCFESRTITNHRSIGDVDVYSYLFDPAKFVEYFNGVSHHGFKLSDVPSATIKITAESVATKNPVYTICHQSVRGQPFAFDNHRKAAEHLLQYVKF